ncbi:3-methyl-2-oxobutanoate hydroxymethyltransferase [Rhodospirillum centenum]|uniref:3-methyl-2-oxobutanoate hydroxymethyltransferase n=1 Tax=Rhodospirillum centenum (strain ATCC 51521 / SW) TaxID=414684 RepID=PANB_RHOCS|nr:3-methyl-2-oxobutanoate hydroxymethyltransferase [Rhodospirillum centenum]B6IX34.1 RecName: Full=3-methyl-2-oxobutanoate hydroxymethyltransferase; AltName: Full=Ketopantoate hydroxymethyltransferase; Short=KPHMT [Rhodospirillum centenum SW]ACJ00858.1 3-methyl-2-oxobutanoate hydroxymethyltransferase [Rhodospirillum centenum SW]
MSATGQSKRLAVPDIAARKGREPVAVLTAYTVSMARLLDPHVEVLLVGDSLGMVLYGFDSTLPVTLDMMIAHGAAVVRGSSRACVVVDMPWASYQEGREQAFRNAARILAETGCAAVKLEGGEEMAETVDFLVRRGIPVMGHVGLTPQAVNALGGYRARGRSDAEQAKILGDARAVAEAGAFALVVEGVVEPLARAVTEAVPCVTIGIGASAACDGQVLVSDDLLGLYGAFTPKFVRRYAELGPVIEEAAATYAADVRARRFPGTEHVFAARKAS